MTKKLNVAVQMDPLEDLTLAGDSTFVIALEAQKRNFNLFHYTPNDLVYKSGELYARMKRLSLSYHNKVERFDYGKETLKNLSDFNFILMRQDPPFNMNYITATHLLEKVSKNTMVVNNPSFVRNSTEKIFVTNFHKLMPETIITRDLNEIKSFREKHKDIIIKPLYGNGGEGIFHITNKSDNFNSILEICFKQYKEQLIIQKYLPEVRKGDKRILLIDGEIVGAVNRVPSSGDSRSNMHAGGTPKKTFITKSDMQICNKISHELKKRELFFVGIDVIGNYITEINVTSPTGICEINNFNKTKIEKIFWDKLIEKLVNHQT